MHRVIDQNQWAASPGRWSGKWEGGRHGMPVSLLFHSSVGLGRGMPPICHPYPVAVVVQRGRARFTVGDDTFEARAGQIVVCPANVPHAFQSIDDGILETVNVHASGEATGFAPG